MPTGIINRASNGIAARPSRQIVSLTAQPRFNLLESDLQFGSRPAGCCLREQGSGGLANRAGAEFQADPCNPCSCIEVKADFQSRATHR